MIAEIISFAGTSVGGAIVGQIAHFIQSRSDAKDKRMQMRHEQLLAEQGALSDYYANISKHNPNLNHALCGCVWMLCFTYCVFTFYCIAINPQEVARTLDPSESPRKFQFLWGLMGYEWKREKIIEITNSGVGLLLCYPIVFILSSVLTGIVPKRFR